MGLIVSNQDCQAVVKENWSKFLLFLNIVLLFGEHPQTLMQLKVHDAMMTGITIVL